MCTNLELVKIRGSPASMAHPPACLSQSPGCRAHGEPNHFHLHSSPDVCPSTSWSPWKHPSSTASTLRALRRRGLQMVAVQLESRKRVFLWADTALPAWVNHGFFALALSTPVAVSSATCLRKSMPELRWLVQEPHPYCAHRAKPNPEAIDFLHAKPPNTTQ